VIDFIAIANRVALLMGLDRGQDADHSPPIIWMRDTWAMNERFPEQAMAAANEGRDLIGMYYAGMIYLSLPDVTAAIYSHECAHYFGADEEQATEIGEKF